MNTFRCKDTKFADFLYRHEKMLDQKAKILQERREKIFPRRIFPSDDMVFEVLRYIRPEDVRKVIVLPHPYPFDSGTGVPCMIRNDVGHRPKSLLNIQKIEAVKDNDFTNLWKNGILLYNISLTEEEDFDNKIPHEIFWSSLFELFLGYMSTNFNGITFYLTGSTCNKYKKHIDTTNNHNIVELPAITSRDFSNKFLAGSTSNF